MLGVRVWKICSGFGDVTKITGRIRDKINATTVLNKMFKGSLLSLKETLKPNRERDLEILKMKESTSKWKVKRQNWDKGSGWETELLGFFSLFKFLSVTGTEFRERSIDFK